jgi:hypothetical protein
VKPSPGVVADDRADGLADAEAGAAGRQAEPLEAVVGLTVAVVVEAVADLVHGHAGEGAAGRATVAVAGHLAVVGALAEAERAGVAQAEAVVDEAVAVVVEAVAGLDFAG